MRCVLFALLPVVLLGCDVLAPACSMAGCMSGVRVAFATPPTQPYRVELLLGDDAVVPVAVEECTRADGRCAPVFFQVQRPGERARLRVTIGAGSVTTAAQVLTYQRSQPNGSDCPPTCYIATLAAPLPSAALSGDPRAAAS